MNVIKIHSLCDMNGCNISVYPSYTCFLICVCFQIHFQIQIRNEISFFIMENLNGGGCLNITAIVNILIETVVCSPQLIPRLTMTIQRRRLDSLRIALLLSGTPSSHPWTSEGVPRDSIGLPSSHLPSLIVQGAHISFLNG